MVKRSRAVSAKSSRAAIARALKPMSLNAASRQAGYTSGQPQPRIPATASVLSVRSPSWDSVNCRNIGTQTARSGVRGLPDRENCRFQTDNPSAAYRRIMPTGGGNSL